MTSLVLGQYVKTGGLVYKGHVTLGVGGAPFRKILEQPQVPYPPFEVTQGHGDENAVWIEPSLVCIVSYMQKTNNGGMRQPVFKGLREDKMPEECIETKQAPGI